MNNIIKFIDDLPSFDINLKNMEKLIKSSLITLLTITLFSITLIVPTISSAKFGSNERPKIKKDAAMTSTRGVIFLNEKVIKKYLEGYNFVNIDYNVRNRRIALKPEKIYTNSNSTYIYHCRNNKVAIVMKKGFFKKFKLNMKRSYFNCSWDSDKKVIIIDLRDPVDRKDLEQ